MSQFQENLQTDGRADSRMNRQTLFYRNFQVQKVDIDADKSSQIRIIPKKMVTQR